MTRYAMVISLVLSNVLSSSANVQDGKKLFLTKKKGSIFSCATCHPGGGSAGKGIPDLRGIGKRKTYDQIRRISEKFAKSNQIPLTKEELDDISKWLFFMNK